MEATPPFTLARYGADDDGLICGYLFAGDGPAQPVDAGRALAWLQAERAAPGFAWLHFNLSHAGAEPWLRAHGDLSEDFFEALHQGSRSTRLQREGDRLFAVVNDVTFDFAFEASDVSTLWVSLQRRLVITARKHPLRAVDRLRLAAKRGDAIASPVALLDHLLGDQADELLNIARRASDRVDDIEDELLAGKQRHHAAELSRLRRLMVRLQRQLAPEPGAFARLLGSPPAWVSPEDVQRLRHAHEEFGTVLRDLSNLNERIKLLQEEAAARVAEENNRSLFVLTLVTVMALPVNLISGLLGMNVGGVPLNQHGHGFWWVLGFVLAVTGMLRWLLWRRLAPR
jgi:zinc transporter